MFRKRFHLGIGNGSSEPGFNRFLAVQLFVFVCWTLWIFILPSLEVWIILFTLLFSLLPGLDCFPILN